MKKSTRRCTSLVFVGICVALVFESTIPLVQQATDRVWNSLQHELEPKPGDTIVYFRRSDVILTLLLSKGG